MINSLKDEIVNLKAKLAAQQELTNTLLSNGNGQDPGLQEPTQGNGTQQPKSKRYNCRKLKYILRN